MVCVRVTQHNAWSRQPAWTPPGVSALGGRMCGEPRTLRQGGQVTELGRAVPGWRTARVPGGYSPHRALVPQSCERGPERQWAPGRGPDKMVSVGPTRGRLGASVSPYGGVTGLSGVPGVDQIFMREPDAWDFLRKRGKRSSKSREEAAGKGAARPVGRSAGWLGRGHRRGPWETGWQQL